MKVYEVPATIFIPDTGDFAEVEVQTKQLPARPFPAKSILIHIRKDGSISGIQNCKKLRSATIKQLLKEVQNDL